MHGDAAHRAYVGDELHGFGRKTLEAGLSPDTFLPVDFE